MDSTLILFTALVAGALGFCLSSLLTARIVHDLVAQLEDLDAEFESLLCAKSKTQETNEIQ